VTRSSGSGARLRLARRIAPAAAIAAAVAASGCGYRSVQGVVPGGGRAVHVPVVRNETACADLAAALTASLREAVAMSGLDAVGDGEGAPRLEVSIESVEAGPGSVASDGDRLSPVDLIWRMEVEARIVSPSGRVLAGPERIASDGRSLAGSGAVADEALGARARLAVADAIAAEVVGVLLEGG